MKEYRYYKGTSDNRETVEMDLYNDAGAFRTTCRINIDMLLSCVRRFPCTDGSFHDLSESDQLYVLMAVQKERKKYTSCAKKSLEMWEKSGIGSLEEYLTPGDRVDDALVSELVNRMPPLLMRASCTQIAEPFAEVEMEHGFMAPIYLTFHKSSDQYTFDGYCFCGENQNRWNQKNRLARRIDELNIRLSSTACLS